VATFVGRSSVRVDWQFASGTYRIIRSAEADLDGIDSATDFYCDNDSNGTFFSIDQVTGLRCRLHYDDVGEINELEDYLVTTSARCPLPLPDKIDDECPECGMAITGSTDSLRMLSSKDFLCIDFETPTGTDGAGPLRSGCIGNVSTLPVDLEWASNPNSETAPCCRNQSIVFASLYLVAEAALYYSNTHVAHGNMTICTSCRDKRFMSSTSSCNRTYIWTSTSSN